MMGWKEEKAGMAAVLYCMRDVISARMARSRMSGVARSESSHVLCITMVLRPPMKISDVYSSIARFESATYGTYLITTTWSGCSFGAYSIEIFMGGRNTIVMHNTCEDSLLATPLIP